MLIRTRMMIGAGTALERKKLREEVMNHNYARLTAEAQRTSVSDPGPRQTDLC